IPANMDSPPIYGLPQDTLHMIFSNLSLRQITICKSVCKFFNRTLTSSSFVDLISTDQPPLSLLALRPSHHHRHCHSHNHRHHHVSSYPSLHVFDPASNEWLVFNLTFLPFRFLSPVTSSLGLVFLWGNSDSPDSNKSLVVCNPLTQTYRVLPQLGSAWCKHGSVLAGSRHRVLVLTELATLYLTGFSSNNWLKFSSNLPSKPRSPIIVSESLYALCDVGTPWRSQWKLYTCALPTCEESFGWSTIEKREWGDVFDIFKRPRLVRGLGNKLLMVGGLKSSFSLNVTCTTIVILRLDLDTLEWDEAGRMPSDMCRCFQESSKFKVFGGGDRLCFSAKRVGKLALWDCSVEEAVHGVWKWIDGMPGYGDGLCRGFVFDARLDAMP
ncbi:SKP1-interacting partner 15, partial [Ancistrocladus abbreviatus]